MCLLLSISSSFAVLFVIFQIKTGSNFVNLLTNRSFSFRIKSGKNENNYCILKCALFYGCHAQGYMWLNQK